MTQLRGQLTYPDLRRQIARATSTSLPLVPYGIYINDIAVDMADGMLSISAKVPPCFKHPP